MKKDSRLRIYNVNMGVKKTVEVYYPDYPDYPFIYRENGVDDSGDSNKEITFNSGVIIISYDDGSTRRIVGLPYQVTITKEDIWPNLTPSTYSLLALY